MFACLSVDLTMHLWKIISCWLIPKQKQTAEQEVLHDGKL